MSSTSAIFCFSLANVSTFHSTPLHVPSNFWKPNIESFSRKHISKKSPVFFQLSATQTSSIFFGIIFVWIKNRRTRLNANLDKLNSLIYPPKMHREYWRKIEGLQKFPMRFWNLLKKRNTGFRFFQGTNNKNFFVPPSINRVSTTFAKLPSMHLRWGR